MQLIHHLRKLVPVIALLVGAAILSVPPQAFAAACPDGTQGYECADIINGHTQWIPDDGIFGVSCSGATGTVSVPVTGDNPKTIFDFFTSHGYTPEQTAGIMGNLFVESHFDPHILQGGHDVVPAPSSSLGYGIAQWTPSSKLLDYAKAVNLTAEDLTTQIQFLYQQLEGTTPNGMYSEKAAGTALKQQQTAASAAVSFMVNYERPADHSPTGPNALARAKAAESVLAQYGAGAATSPTGGQPVGASVGSCAGAPGNSSGPGKGQFKDAAPSNPGPYAELAAMQTRAQQIIINNSALETAACGPGGNCTGQCERVVEFVWMGRGGYYGSALADWAAQQAMGTAHPGSRDVPVGALLFYATGHPAGHVAIYLGNNKVMSTDVLGNGNAYITDASEIETGSWHLAYLGWSDPVFK